MRHDIRRLNLKPIIEEIAKIENVEEIYIFGSRAYETGSVRSDIDLLVYAPKAQIDAEIEEIMDAEKALDIFETTDKTQANSFANGSFIRRENLIQKLDAICLWTRKDGFTTEVDNFKSLTLLKDRYPEMTRLPIYSKDAGRFYDKYGPDAVFIIMPFAKDYDKLYLCIQRYLKSVGMTAVRADEYKFSEHVWQNIEIYLECCKRAVALFPYTSERNPNVALEVGYMLAKGGRICLLKDDRVEKLFSDIASIMYNNYNESSYEKDISDALDKWIANDFK